MKKKNESPSPEPKTQDEVIAVLIADLKAAKRMLHGACKDGRIEPRDGCGYVKTWLKGKCKACPVHKLINRIKEHLLLCGEIV